MPTYHEVSVGDQLPELVKSPDRLQLVQYCAGSGDFNPLHWDVQFPQAQAIGDNIVHGRMKYASLGELVSNWLGHRGRVVSISCQYRGMDMQGATFVCKGQVTAKHDDRHRVEIEVWTENAEGKKTTPGTAVVELPA
jgi:acyl dehydratase